MDCVFCKIVDGDIPSDTIYEDDQIIAFKDLDPQAPIHFLVIPKKHITSLATLEDSDSALIAHIMKSIKRLAEEKGLESYRVLTKPPKGFHEALTYQVHARIEMSSKVCSFNQR